MNTVQFWNKLCPDRPRYIDIKDNMISLDANGDFKSNEECHLSRSKIYLEANVYTCYVDVHLYNLLYNV